MAKTSELKRMLEDALREIETLERRIIQEHVDKGKVTIDIPMDMTAIFVNQGYENVVKPLNLEIEFIATDISTDFKAYYPATCKVSGYMKLKKINI
jgi:hypothetical protein